MINALANVNETSHALGYQTFLKQKKPFKQVGAKGFDKGKSLDGWKREWMQRSVDAGAEQGQIVVKDRQGSVGAAAIAKWLREGGIGYLGDWESRVGDNFFTARPIKIDKVAWTPCGVSFTNFINTCASCKGLACWRGTKHANNPSDVLLMVTNSANPPQTTIIGVSLKATFKNAALTIYNGGVCGFLYLIVDRQDLDNKESYCTTRGPVAGTSYGPRVIAVIEPYTQFCRGLVNKIQGYPPEASTSAAKQAWWKTNVQPSKNQILKPALIKLKLNALGGVRDNLLAQIKSVWGQIQEDQSTAITMLMTRDNLAFALAGILQFTHSDVARGGCKVPYVKLTAFGNMKIEIKPPAIEKYLEDAGNAAGGGDHISVKIVKRGADSLMLCIYKVNRFVPYFLIRVKCASRPPGSLKIDIKPVKTPQCVQTGGDRRPFPRDVEEYIQKVPSELDVMLQNLLEDTFPDCEPSAQVRPKRNCKGEIVNYIEVDEVVKEEIAACNEEELSHRPLGVRQAPLTQELVMSRLAQALNNKLSIIQSKIPPHSYSTRIWTTPEFWRQQKQLVYNLDNFLFKHPYGVSVLPPLTGGSRKRRTKRRRRRKRRYKKRKRKTRRKKY